MYGTKLYLFLFIWEGAVDLGVYLIISLVYLRGKYYFTNVPGVPGHVNHRERYVAFAWSTSDAFQVN